MFVNALAEVQKEFFFGLNKFAEPLIRAGFGNPVCLPAGTIVVETTGRKTSRKINLPVLAARIGDFVVFSTVRRNSQWVKNLAAKPEVRYWLAGQPRNATAFVFSPNQKTLPENLPLAANCLARILQAQSGLLGISFAMLTPRN